MDNKNVTIAYQGRPLFQLGKMTSGFEQMSQLENLACFFYMIEGNYEAIESHGTYVLGKKEALVKKFGNYVARFYNPGESDVCEAVAIYLYPDIFEEVYKGQFPIFSGTESSTPKVISNELIDKYINNLYVYFENPEMIDEELAIHKLKELIMLLLRSEQYKNVQHFLSEIFSPEKLEFSTVVENNLFSNLTLEEFAFVCNRSLSSFKRDFKKYMGASPAKYIKQRRLEEAAKLLKVTDKNITNIAYEVGFVDPTTFSSSFLDQYGVSPTKYRLS